MGLKGFVEGGIASIVAGVSTHPLDLIKVRMQLSGEYTTAVAYSLRPAAAGVATVAISPPHVGPISMGLRILEAEGAAALFSGVSATVLRQTLYSTTRMGLYEALKTKWTDPETRTIPLGRKIAAGLVAGGVGAAVGNPADVAMVRMQADGRLPPNERRNYAGVTDAIRRILQQEGVVSLWRGSGLTVTRAMVVTASQLASYDQIKETIITSGTMGDGIVTHVAASFAAGFVAAAASNPIDVIKTRVMNMRVEAGCEAPYKGAVDCAMKTIVDGKMFAGTRVVIGGNFATKIRI